MLKIVLAVLGVGLIYGVVDWIIGLHGLSLVQYTILAVTHAAGGAIFWEAVKG